MLKLFKTVDKDQRVTVYSSVILTFITMLIVIFMPKPAWLFIFPLQFVITYIFFCARKIRKINNLYIDRQSHTKWSVNFSEAFLGVSVLLMSVSLAVALIIPSKLVAAVVMLCPLWLTRAVIFLRKLPLDAMYPLKELRSYEQESYSTVQRYFD